MHFLVFVVIKSVIFRCTIAPVMTIKNEKKRLITLLIGNKGKLTLLTLSRRRPLSYRNQSIDLLCKSMDWFLYDNGLSHERVNLV